MEPEFLRLRPSFLLQPHMVRVILSPYTLITTSAHWYELYRQADLPGLSPQKKRIATLGFEGMTEQRKEHELPIRRPLALDPLAKSGSQTEPAFIARPAGAPVYHGFEVLSDVVVGGFTLGKITDFEIETCAEGDAFVVAPDNSRAGLVWEVSDKSYFQEILPPEAERWGVWGVSFPNAMTSRETARQNLACILPELKKRWEEWHRIQLKK